MKSLLVVCLLAGSSAALWAQNAATPVLRPGVSVKMAVARNAVEMRAADEQNATVVAVTAEGKLYIGVKPAQLADLSKLSAQTVYVKADARTQYQTILDVLEALHGKRVSLLTASPGNAEKGKILPPYGVDVRLGQ